MAYSEMPSIESMKAREQKIGFGATGIDSLKSSHAITIILLFAFLILLIFSHLLHEHYGGITVDERAEWYNVKIQLARGIGFLRGSDITEVPVTYYGIANTFLAYVGAYIFNLPISGYYHITHILTVSCAIGTVVLLWWASKICQLSNRWLAPLMLLASPTFFGYSLMNIKDIPIAFLYTLFTCTLIWFYKYLCKFTLRRFSFATFVTSLVAGTFISLRLTLFPVTIATFVLIQYLIIPPDGNCCLSLFPRWRGSLKTLLICSSTLIFTLLIFLTSTLLLPGSWDSPINFFADAFNTFRDYTIWDGCTLYMGECTSKLNNKDWTTGHYLLQWWFSQPTLLNIFNSLIGIPLGLAILTKVLKAKNVPNIRKAGIILFSAQAYLVPILAVLTNATLYNGIRHLLFMLPAIAFLGGTFADIICSSRLKISLPIGQASLAFTYSAILFTSIAITLADTAWLAPYQYSYINEFRRSALTAGTTELEVWGMSLGELYDHHKKISNLFPNDLNKSLILTRESIGITAPASDNSKIQKLVSTPIGNSVSKSNLLPGCNIISEVSRNYASSQHRVVFSAVSECLKQ